MPHVVSFLVTLIAFLGMRNITRGGAMAAADDIAIRFTFFPEIKKTDFGMYGIISSSDRI